MRMLRLLLLLHRLFPGATSIERHLRARWENFWQQQRDEELQADPSTRELPPIVDSERAVFIEAIFSFWPFHSVLELGCGYGQNAHILQAIAPGIRYLGIDSAEERVVAGQRLFGAGERPVKLIQADATELKTFPDHSAELVISAAFLLYIGPEKLALVLQEMARLCQKGIVLLEQHDEQSDAVGRQVSEPGRPSYWIRNYEAVAREYLPGFSLERYRVAKPRWTIEQWARYASVLILRPTVA